MSSLRPQPGGRISMELVSATPEGVVYRAGLYAPDADWHGEEFTARTWVRQSDGIVLRQEAIFQGQTLVLERESG